MRLMLGQTIRDPEGRTYVYIGQHAKRGHTFVLAHPWPKGTSIFDAQFDGVKDETLIKRFPDLEHLT